MGANIVGHGFNNSNVELVYVEIEQSLLKKKNQLRLVFLYLKFTVAQNKSAVYRVRTDSA